MTVATDVHLTKGISDRYDIIIGRDLMQELGLKLNFNDDVIEFYDLSVPMSDIDVQPREELKFTTSIKEPASAAEAVDRVSRILDAKYAPVTLQQVLDNSPHLTDNGKECCTYSDSRMIRGSRAPTTGPVFSSLSSISRIRRASDVSQNHGFPCQVNW
eukprot:scaffold12526_cov69-Cylindrotheca_fusiformis.AAC.1